MVTWNEFATAEPELADIGRSLRFQSRVGLAFLATVRKDGAPRLHPVCPVLSSDRLFALITPTSPKRNDLLRDGRYALQSFPQPQPGSDEFYVAGKAMLVEDSATHGEILRDAKHMADVSETAFELWIDRVMHTRWENVLTPQMRPVHTKWRAPAAMIQRFDILSPPARTLIAALNAELTSRYPEAGANHFRLDPDEVADGQGAFLIASRAAKLVGCGAIRRIEARTGQIKRMYVSPEERGRGLGRALLEALETEARGLGISRLVLETGVRQPEAIALYERAGFATIAPFGEYVDSPLSVCMAKEL